MLGKEYTEGKLLLVVGQAVNEWLPSRFTIGDDEHMLNAHIKLAFEEWSIQTGPYRDSTAPFFGMLPTNWSN